MHYILTAYFLKSSIMHFPGQTILKSSTVQDANVTGTAFISCTNDKKSIWQHVAIMHLSCINKSPSARHFWMYKLQRSHAQLLNTPNQWSCCTTTVQRLRSAQYALSAQVLHNDDLLLYSISRGVLACTATESLNKSTDPYAKVKQRQANSALFQTDWQQSNADF